MMMDASAVIAIMHGELGADLLLDRLLAASRRMTHPMSFYEAALAAARLKSRDVTFGQTEVQQFLTMTHVHVVDVGPTEAFAALEAFARYGKGRHPANLNMGDCFSYACAKVRGMPLLYKGDDFALTDLA